MAVVVSQPHRNHPRCSTPADNAIVTLLVLCLAVFALSARPLPAAAVNVASPTSPVKLIFIHHSVGDDWLTDGQGNLGIALRDSNYFVSDTHYNWGPDGIGSNTDIGHWWTWFRGPSSSTYLSALYAESRQISRYSRLAADPGGPNQIVMFKSCFPNSQVGPPYSPVPAIEDNEMKGHGAGYAFTVANAKGIYVDLLQYFGAHPEKMFVAVVAPPVVTPDTPGGRELANWLVNNWLQDAGYTTGNVLVFDLYNVLTSKTGGGASDVGLATGNHHRIWNGAVQHKTDDGTNHLAYPRAAGDSHPSAAGLQKATAEFVPLLNAAYNAWKGNAGSDTKGPRTYAPRSATVRKGARAVLYYRVTDNISPRASVTIRIRTRAGVLKKTLTLGLKRTGPALRHVRFRCRLSRGVYRFTVYARDLSGNAAQQPLGRNRLTVR